MMSKSDRVQDYCRKYDVPSVGGTGDAVDALLADAEHLRAEVERQREEIAALQEALTDARNTMRGIVNSVPDKPQNPIETSYRNGRKDSAAFAMGWLERHADDNASAPEPETRCQYCGRIDAECICHNALIEVNQPAPESAPEIKVGDSVRITQLPSALHGRAGTVVQVTGQLPVYAVRVWGGNTLDFMRDQIEPA